MRVITTEENILEALDAAFQAGYQNRKMFEYSHAAPRVHDSYLTGNWGASQTATGQEIIRRSEQATIQQKLDIIKSVSHGLSANSQALESISRLADNIGGIR
jgi:hypothetical protein